MLLRRLLPLQTRQMGRLVAHEYWIVDRLAVAEHSPVVGGRTRRRDGRHRRVRGRGDPLPRSTKHSPVVILTKYEVSYDDDARCRFSYRLFIDV